MKIKDITVVIRSAGERTLDLCHSLVSEQVEEQNIFIIKEKPFSKAVLKNFEIGIENGHKYTLAIDADILLYNKSIELLVKNFSNLTEDYFVYQGLVYDKFFNKFRGGGPHLYRTSMLKKAITFIPEEGTSYRPESATYIEMKKLGFHTYQDIWAFGVHDDEQYYRDIYRKFFLHAHKHQSRISSMINSWNENWITDMDFQLALKGISDGLMYKEFTYVDTDFFKTHYNQIQKQFNLSEKTKTLEFNKSLRKKPFLIAESNEFYDSKNINRNKKITIIDKIKYKSGVQFEKWAKQLKKY